MRSHIINVTGTLLLGAVALALSGDVHAQQNSGATKDLIYKIELNDAERARTTSAHPETGEQGLHLLLSLSVRKLKSEDRRYDDTANQHIRIFEDGFERVRLPLSQRDLTIILAMDTAASMREGGKIIQARKAADEFLKILQDNADPAFIAFNQEIRQTIPPIGMRLREQKDLELRRQMLRQQKDEIARAKDMVEPDGGTGYLNAAMEGVNMLRNVSGNKAVVIITDGKDKNSKQSIDDVIAAATRANVQVYTIGVGEPKELAIVMVLDHSGSMSQFASANEKKSKMDALKEAACEYIDRLRPEVPVSIAPFSTIAESCTPFTTDKEELKRVIRALQPSGGTRLYDAVYASSMTLSAVYPRANRRLVVMTDGIDEAPGSRHRYEEVMEIAERDDVKLHLVGFGREHEVDMTVMAKMAGASGTSTWAGDNKKLAEFFKKQVDEANQEAIDVASLQKLANETGGKYVAAKDASKIPEALSSLTQEADQTYHPAFKSLRDRPDGTMVGITLAVFDDTTGKPLSEFVITDVHLHGVVPPGIDWRWYLIMLSFLGLLLIVPLTFRRGARLMVAH